MSKLLFALSLLFLSGASFAQVYGISVSTDKSLYNMGESMQASGFVALVGNSTSAPVLADNVSLSVENASFSPVSADTVVAVSSGYFSSGLSVPDVPGSYFLRVKYTDTNGTVWQSAISFRVTSVSIDAIFIRPNKADYYPGDAMSIVLEPVVELSTGFVGLPDVEVYGSLRRMNGSIIQSFGNCSETGTNRTGSAGTCTVSIAQAPADGAYLLEANDFVGINIISVIPFDAVVSIKDGTGSYLQSVFSGDQSAKLVVSVGYNGSLPANGSYYFAGNVSYANGTVALPVPRVNLSNSTYSGSYSFTTGNFSTGTYTVYVLVSMEGGGSVSATTFFDVRTWSLSVDKLSGFASSYNAYPGTAVSFSVSASDLLTGGSVPLTSNNTNVSLFSRLGTKLADYVPVWNSTLNASVVSFAVPSTVGTYYLSVSASSGGTTQSAERAFKVIDVVASALSTDGERQPKDLFGGSEFVYVLASAENYAGSLAVTGAEISEIRAEDGSKLNYTGASWGADSNSTYEWRVNVSGGKAFFKIDNPKGGGAYSVKIYVNTSSGTSVATAKFVIDPYLIFAAPRGETDESTWGSRWQFSTRDKVFFTVRVSNANRQSGTSRMAYESMYGGGMSTYYTPAGSSSASAVVNATVAFEQVSNDLLMQSLPLSTLNVSCTSTDGTGRADCSAIPASGKWDGGWYHVIFRVTGSDGVTSGMGHSGFEARSFYISGYTFDPNRTSSGMGWGDGKWVHNPADNVSVRAYMFDAGNTGWWGYYAGGNSQSSSAGLSGTIAVEKILYRGSAGAWIWPPVTVASSDYTTSGTGSVSSGQGNLTIRPASQWKTGSYTAVLRGTKVSGNDSETDYGQVWFEVRRWDTWASPVSLNSSSWRSSFSIRENATLYVNIRPAGDYCWGSCPQASLAGGAPVTIGVKKIEDYSSWPPKEMDRSRYSVNSISVSSSSPSSMYPLNTSYVLNIAPASGAWDSGYYNVVLDINGTETGYGWFSAIAFYANAQFVDGYGGYKYASKGDTDVYFNVTTSLSPYYGWGSPPSDAISTTVKDVKLRGYSDGGWVPVEYSFVSGAALGEYEFNVTPVSVGGQQRITLHKNGSWSSGSYNGEIVLQDSSGSTATAWIYFSVKPFEISTSTYSWEISSKTSVNVSLRIIQDWSNYSTLVGNYTVESVKETVWNYGGGAEYRIDTYLPNNQTTFGGQTDLLISPNSSWSAGYHSLMITVRDNSTPAKRGTAWVSFNSVPFAVDIVNERWAYRPYENVSLNVTIRATSSYGSPPASANLSRVIEVDWSSWPPRETDINFSVFNSTGRMINGSANVTLLPPGGNWTQRYHSIELQFVDSDTNGSLTKRQAYFDVRIYDLWAYPANLTNGWWVQGFDRAENATVKLNVNTIGSYLPAAVNVTKVEYRKSYNWMDPYSEKNYSVACISPYTIWVNGSERLNSTPCVSQNAINGTGLVLLAPPPGGWDYGYYDAKITVSGAEGIAQTSAWFQIIDRNPPGITIHSPAAGQLVNESSWPVLLLAETTKLANCEFKTGTMYWRNWLSYRQLNHSAYLYDYYLPSNGNNTVTVYCRDDFGNENFTNVTFYVNLSSRGVPPRLNGTSPASGDVNVSLSPTITAVFTRAMSWVSVYLTSSAGSYVSLNYSSNYNTTVASFVPYYSLSQNTTYNFTIYSGTDMSGNYLEGIPILINFTTGVS